MLIYIYKNRQQSGPFEEAKVLQWLASGQLSPEDLAVKQGESQWRPLKMLFPSVPQKPLNQGFGFGNPNAPAGIAATNLPQKSGGSKGVLFLILGLGGLILISAIGVVGFFIIGKSNRTTVNISNYNSNSNSSYTNSNTNSNVLNFQPLRDKAKELAALKPQLKPERKPILQGKIVILEQTEKDYSPDLKGIKSSGDSYDDEALKDYGLTKEQLAAKPEEIDTLVQILCSKGGRIGTYITSLGSVPAYSKVCKVSIINYRDSKIIAQKTFVNRKLKQTVALSQTDTEYVLLSPYEEIQRYVKSLPKQ